MNKLVAVVLNFRTPDKTLDCLRSLAKEGITRVVLVENSEDGGASMHAMQSGLVGLCDAGVMVDIVDEGRNLGFAAGVNRALDSIMTRGLADVLLLNSDARLLPGCLQTLRDAIRSGADLAAPMLISAMGESKRPVSYYQIQTGLVSQHALPGALLFTTGACVLLSAHIVGPGLFDEAFFFYGEDVMLAAKLKEIGCRSVVAETAFAVHEGSGSSHNGSLFYEYHINRGHLLLARKLPKSAAGRLMSMLGRCVFLPLRALARALRSGESVPLRGFSLALLSVAKGEVEPLTPPPTSR